MGRRMPLRRGFIYPEWVVYHHTEDEARLVFNAIPYPPRLGDERLEIHIKRGRTRGLDAELVYVRRDETGELVESYASGDAETWDEVCGLQQWVEDWTEEDWAEARWQWKLTAERVAKMRRVR